MARPMTVLAVFFIGMNLFAAILGSTGVAAMLGLDATTGESEAINQQVSDMRETTSGAPTGQTLFGMYQVLASQVTGFFHTIMPGLAMLHRAGVPSYLTAGFLAPLFSVLIGVTTISFLRGWSL